MNNKHDLLDIADDAFNYFLDFRLEELKSDDQYYINALLSYIEHLESKVTKLTKELYHK